MIRVSEPVIGQTEIDAVVDVLRSGQITMGPRVEEFEQRFAAAVGSRHAVMMSSGTTALHASVVAYGAHAGDEVIVPDLTYIATANAVGYTGARPVFVDVDKRDWCLDVAQVEAAVTARTVGIIAVHLYGVPANMPELRRIARSRGLWLIEDAAEALGGSAGPRALGTLGDAGVFSFYANKLLTTGEGGCVVTDSKQHADLLRALRGQGQGAVRYRHEIVGFNYRPTELQAALGLAQLENLFSALRVRQTVLETYQNLLRTALEFPVVPGMAPWLFTGVLPAGTDRTRVAGALAAAGIETRPAFVPMHEQPPYVSFGAANFPCATRIGARGISLPTHPGMVDQTSKIAGTLLTALAKERAL